MLKSSATVSCCMSITLHWVAGTDAAIFKQQFSWAPWLQRESTPLESLLPGGWNTHLLPPHSLCVAHLSSVHQSPLLCQHRLHSCWWCWAEVGWWQRHQSRLAFHQSNKGGKCLLRVSINLLFMPSSYSSAWNRISLKPLCWRILYGPWPHLRRWSPFGSMLEPHRGGGEDLKDGNQILTAMINSGWGMPSPRLRMGDTFQPSTSVFSAGQCSESCLVCNSWGRQQAIKLQLIQAGLYALLGLVQLHLRTGTKLSQ